MTTVISPLLVEALRDRYQLEREPGRGGSESVYGFIVVVAFLMVIVAWGFIHFRMLGWL